MRVQSHGDARPAIGGDRPETEVTRIVGARIAVSEQGIVVDIVFDDVAGTRTCAARLRERTIVDRAA
jgi:hypothetical protein